MHPLLPNFIVIMLIQATIISHLKQLSDGSPSFLFSPPQSTPHMKASRRFLK